ncbi:SDR family NAD(P)-dependent oxidoreductase [Herbidospora mongoliensis]|uniref:SDR family NAD(P)-dependent oxidoreductase n=1 Tax=Herbidospora mongoliensis TaxID=688067 RepID=UPI00082A6F76|nr:SDR family oxidoreductase [Herbidospora mongoliensis]
MTEYASYPSLRDRVALVTGGATGLGAEFVAQLAAQGAKVAFVDIDDAGAQRLTDQALYIHADVTDIDALRTAIVMVEQALGPVSILVNNAANDHRTGIEDLQPAEWDQGIAVNLRHQFFASQAVLAGMRSLGGGSIINLGSVSPHVGLLGLPAYVSSKSAIEGLTKMMARELGSDHIRVNCVIPGWVFTERQLTHWVTPEVREKLAEVQCLPDNLEPSDVARMVLWLAADDSAMCTGQNWIVDAGWMM